jgi:hypothetical protein
MKEVNVRVVWHSPSVPPVTWDVLNDRYLINESGCLFFRDRDSQAVIILRDHWRLDDRRKDIEVDALDK